MSSKDLLEYEYLTGEDLGHRPSVLEKNKFEYSPLGMSLSKSFKKGSFKNIANRETASIAFVDFTKSIMNSKRCH